MATTDDTVQALAWVNQRRKLMGETPIRKFPAPSKAAGFHDAYRSPLAQVLGVKVFRNQVPPITYATTQDEGRARVLGLSRTYHDTVFEGHLANQALLWPFAGTDG